VGDRCVRGCAYIVVGCSLIGSGENMKLTNQIGELGHIVIGFYRTEGAKTHRTKMRWM
jgi:hypothetical protein